MQYSNYIALGDSISIDLYPALDLGETDVAVALERAPLAGGVARMGAASLLYENSDRHWPEFAGNDLVSRNPGIRHENLAQDGATIGDVFGEQLPAVVPSEEPTLVTLTVGGNDLLSAYASRPSSRVFDRIVHDIGRAYELLVDGIRERLPHSHLVLNTIYDPTDRTGRLPPGVLDTLDPLPLRHLDDLNAHIRSLATRQADLAVADLYVHFLGRGVTAPENDRWYWRRSMLEPSAEGASEVRRVWLEVIE